MKLRQIAPNQTEIEIGTGINRVVVLFSYETPVAVETASKILVTDYKFSPTTSKHINKWLDGRRHEKVNQSIIESWLEPKKMMEVENNF